MDLIQWSYPSWKLREKFSINFLRHCITIWVLGRNLKKAAYRHVDIPFLFKVEKVPALYLLSFSRKRYKTRGVSRDAKKHDPPLKTWPSRPDNARKRRAADHLPQTTDHQCGQIAWQYYVFCITWPITRVTWLNLCNCNKALFDTSDEELLS